MWKQACFTLTALAVVGFMSGTVAWCQDSTTTPKSFANDYMVGNWTVEGTFSGTVTKGTMRVRPAAKGLCLLYNWTVGSSQDDMDRGLGVACRDPETGEIVEYGFESDGTQFIQRYPAESFPDTGVGYGMRTGTIKGKPYKGKITVDRKGRDEFVFTVASEQGEDVKCVFRRVQDEQVVSPAYEHLKDLEDYVGNWVANDTLTEDMPGFAKKGETVTFRASILWVHNKSILQMDFVSAAPDGKSFEARWNFGWDAVNKKIVYSGFDSLGGRVWGSTKKESPDKWIWESNSAEADGKQGSGVNTTTLLEDNNTHVHEFTNGVVDGKPQPDGKLVYKRVK
ncbi:MAG: hypothetical protein ACYC0X_27330 [Pirellulaceae bacterium]